MKNALSVFTLFNMICAFAFGQSTVLTLQPGINGEDAFVWDYQPNSNFGNDQRLDITAWTASGTPYISRGFLKFDLTSIPSGAIVLNASLSLYHNNTTLNYNGIHSGLNGSVLQFVTGSWQEGTISWNNQPTTTTSNQVFIPQTVSGSQDFIDLDVTAMVGVMVNYPMLNNGFLLRLQSENYYSNILVAASDHFNPALHPKLVVTYVVASAVESDEKESESIILYPNPVTDISVLRWNFEIGNSVSIDIYDSMGRLILQRNDIDDNEMQIKWSDFNAGIYYLKFASSNQVEEIIKFSIL
jgi:Secretion system C-terminal sorting domain